MVSDRKQYRKRIEKLVCTPPMSPDPDDLGYEAEVQAHWAKYTCVLISGFIEQAVKEIILEHASSAYSSRVSNYVECTWPSSKNMRCNAIRDLLGCFDDNWKTSFEKWLCDDERVKEINEIVSWRNHIAHGNEANTNNVTLNSVGNKFRVACDLVDFVEELLCVKAHERLDASKDVLH